MVTPTAHHLPPAAPHAVDSLASGGKNPAVENLVLAALDEPRMGRIEADQIERRLWYEADTSPRPCGIQRLRASRERGIEKTAPGRVTRFPGQHVAHSAHESLGILQSAQLRCGIQESIGVRSDAEPSAPALKLQGRENAISETRLGDRTEPDHRARRRDALELRLRRVGCVHQTPLLIDRGRLEQTLDRRPSTPGNAFLDFAHLLGNM